ncbi:MAG: 23S rRNA (uracil(1939)-C(5))-methyltransferase RlmD [Acidobacteriota bacterium]|nr:23S rRNA (uracil(1939)-C(5))-methyltransferase RlmD [Acidobacteriota bacterium]
MIAENAELVQIEKPVYGGSCLARLHGKTIFVPLTLPGEQVRIRITQDKRSFATAEAVEIPSPSPLRVTPECPHFGACGGCDYQHASYATQLAWKEAILRETLQRASVPLPQQIAVLSAEPWRYRNRIRLAIDAHGNLGYRGRHSHAVVPVAACSIAAPLLMRAAMAIEEALRQARPKLLTTEVALFCNAEETAVLASLLTQQLSKLNVNDLAQALKDRVPEVQGVEILAQARDRKTTQRIAQWGEPSLSYRAAGSEYRVDQGAFFQVNRWLVDALVERVSAGDSGSLAWDLFAGVGLFARHLAHSHQRVVAVESAPASIAALRHNLAGLHGTAVQADTLNFLRRNVAAERPDRIIVDPPRTGLDAEVTTLLGTIAAPALVYVSCDPATLARDLKALLASGYHIHSATLVDLFPQTFHLETIVHLRRS